MSTRSSLLSGDSFHLFQDLADRDLSDTGPPLAVYLSLTGPSLSWSFDGSDLTVRIPAAVWEAIRRCPLVGFAGVREDETTDQLIALKSADETMRCLGRNKKGLFAMSVIVRGMDPDTVTKEQLVDDELRRRREYRKKLQELAVEVNKLLGRQPDHELD